MALTSEEVIAKIEMVGQYKSVSYATDKIVKEDGIEIARTRTRNICTIGYLDNSDNLVEYDYSALPQEIKDVIAVAYTDERKEGWRQKLIADKDRI
jgi:hypothetical protein